MKKIIGIFIIILAFILVSCGPSFQVKKPEGFAQYPIKNNVYRAISPDGTRVKLRVEKNKPYGTAKMWNDAANLHLKNRGYGKLQQKNIETSNGMKGHYTEYIYRYLGKNYIYSVTVFADKERIYIVEASGIEKYYKNKGNFIKKWLEAHVVLK